MRRWCRLLFVLVGLVVGGIVLAGCQAEAALHIDVNEDGSGLVTASVIVDPEAASRTILFESPPLVDDLEATGWTVVGPTQLADTTYQITASKGFSRADQLHGIIEELAGPGGPFRDFDLDRATSFADRSWTLTGTVDLTKGLAGFSDDELNAQLGGPPLGADKAAQDAALGRTLESIIHVTVQARLPGTLESHNGTVRQVPRTSTTTAPPTTAGSPGGAPLGPSTTVASPSADPVVWEPSFADPAPTHLEASSSSSQLAPRLWRWLAAAAALVGLAVLLYQLAFAGMERWREHRRAQRRRVRPLPTLSQPEPELEGVGAVIEPGDDWSADATPAGVGASALSVPPVTARSAPSAPRRPPASAPPRAPSTPAAPTSAPPTPAPAVREPAPTPAPAVRPPAAVEEEIVAAPGPPPVTAEPPVADVARVTGAARRSAGGARGAVRLLVMETAGGLFSSSDPVRDLLVPHVRARGSTLSVVEVNDSYVSRVVGGLRPAEFWLGLGILGDPMLLDDSYARRYELSPDVEDFLGQAVSRGMDVVTVGEEAPEWVGVFRQRFGLDQLISAWVTSSDVGVRPPHPALVQAALRSSGQPAGAAMVIARNLRLLDGARRLGCRTVQYLPQDTAALGDHPLLRSFARVST